MLPEPVVVLYWLAEHLFLVALPLAVLCLATSKEDRLTWAALAAHPGRLARALADIFADIFREHQDRWREESGRHRRGFARWFLEPLLWPLVPGWDPPRPRRRAAATAPQPSPSQPPQPPAEGPLAETLLASDVEPAEKIAALKDCIASPRDSLAPLLAFALRQEPSARVRRQLVLALAAADLRGLEAGLLEATAADRDEAWVVRVEAARALLRQDRARGLAAARAVLSSAREPAALKTRIVALLVDFPGEAAVPLLLRALKDPEASVFIAAQAALRAAALTPGLGATTAAVLARSIRATREPWRLKDQLNLLLWLERRTRRPSPAGRAAVLRLLTRFAPNEPHAEAVTAAAAEAAGELGLAEAGGALRALSRSESDFVRFKAVEALGRLKVSGALDHLKYLATHDFIRAIRRAAIRAAMQARPATASCLP